MADRSFVCSFRLFVCLFVFVSVWSFSVCFCLFVWLCLWLTVWLVCCLVGWLVDWLLDCCFCFLFWRQISKGRGTSNADLNNNPSLVREESYLRKKGLEGLVSILQNMLRSARTGYYRPAVSHRCSRQVRGVQPIIIHSTRPIILQCARPIVSRYVRPIVIQCTRPIILQCVQPIITQCTWPIVVQFTRPFIFQCFNFSHLYWRSPTTNQCIGALFKPAIVQASVLSANQQSVTSERRTCPKTLVRSIIYHGQCFHTSDEPSTPTPSSKPSRADTMYVFLSCMICMLCLNLPGGSCIPCTVSDMFQGFDLYYQYGGP